ncbi:MAG: HAD family hydrolase [Planctomycetota bacterium]
MRSVETKINSIIFDWGGVLIDDPGPPMIEFCYRALGVSEEVYNEAVGKFVSDFRTGHIEEATFWQQVCAELNIEVPNHRSLWGEAFEAVYRPKPEMFALAKGLVNSGYSVALLSNTEMPCVDYFGKQGYDFFDVLIFSCLEGTKKPLREIYELALVRLKCPPQQAVFIDDRPNCVKGAVAAGLNTIWFESSEQVKRELSGLGVRAD